MGPWKEDPNWQGTAARFRTQEESARCRRWLALEVDIAISFLDLSNRLVPCALLAAEQCPRCVPCICIVVEVPHHWFMFRSDVPVTPWKGPA
jgi:hypothetical protein